MHIKGTDFTRFLTEPGRIEDISLQLRDMRIEMGDKNRLSPGTKTAKCQTKQISKGVITGRFKIKLGQTAALKFTLKVRFAQPTAKM